MSLRKYMIDANEEKIIPESTLRLLLSLEPEIDVIQGLMMVQHELACKVAENDKLYDEISYLRNLVETVVNKV